MQQAQTIERALDVGIFDTVQATWNLLEQSASSALAAAHEAGLGVIVKEALANGRLTARGDVALVQELAERSGATPDVLALAVVLAQPWADVVLSGAATVETLRSNLAALELDIEVPPELAELAEDPASYWKERSALTWN
jgi:aryl-alcohol dehydrogenase-like predicted oxidoreductase